jgi:transposase
MIVGRRKKLFQELEEVPLMTMIGGLDVHRQQITFDYVDDEGLVHFGQIRPATRTTLRDWLTKHCPNGDGEFAVEGCTGWRYVCEELASAGVGVHLGDPAEIAGLRGPKKRAKTDRSDARLMRNLLMEGRFPESWVPPAHVVEVRTLGRLYCALMDERRAWQQRIHAQLFHQGCPPITALLSQAGRATLTRVQLSATGPQCEALARVELSAAGRQYVDIALRRIDGLTAEIKLLRAQLVDFARHQPGCQALQARHYGVGWLSAAIIWAEIGDARRFRSSDQLVRFAGLDITVYSSDAKRAPGRLARQGSPELRWAAFEAAKCAARPRSPDYAYYHQVAARKDGKRPTLAVERKILRRCYHTLRELGDTALAVPTVALTKTIAA